MDTTPAAKTVTVIGSTGLVGSQLVQRLSAADHHVIEVSQSTRATSSAAKVSTMHWPGPTS